MRARAAALRAWRAYVVAYREADATQRVRGVSALRAAARLARRARRQSQGCELFSPLASEGGERGTARARARPWARMVRALSNLAALAGAVVRMPLVELHGQCLHERG